MLVATGAIAEEPGTPGAAADSAPAAEQPAAPSGPTRFAGGLLLPVGGGVHLSVGERYAARGSIRRDESRAHARLTLGVVTRRRFGCSNYTLQSTLSREENRITVEIARVEAYSLCVPPIGPAVSSHALDLDEGHYDLIVGSEGFSDVYTVDVGHDTVTMRAEQTSISTLRPSMPSGTEIPDKLVVPLASVRVVVAHCRYVGPEERMPPVHFQCGKLFDGLGTLGEDLSGNTDLRGDPGWNAFWRSLARPAPYHETRTYRLPAPGPEDEADVDAYYARKMEQIRAVVGPLVQDVPETPSRAPASSAKAETPKSADAAGTPADEASKALKAVEDLKLPPAARPDAYTIKVVTWLGHEYCC